MLTQNSMDSNSNRDYESTEQLPNNFPTTLADLGLNSPSTVDTEDSTRPESIYKILGRLRKSTLSIPNRLRSVLEDANFVQALYDHLNTLCPINEHAGMPVGVWALIPNERSGSWPLDPALKADSQHGYLSSKTPNEISSTSKAPILSRPSASSTPSQLVSAYFKSTDGHINQWAFSLRRLNLPVLSLLGRNRSAIIIDTTRRGKTYPDALRRTVPIYISVWNHILFPELIPTGVCDFQPCNLDASEVAQIKARIPKFVADLKGLGLDFDKIRNETKRPTRCIWVAAPAGGKEELEMTFEPLVEDIKGETNRWENTSGVIGVNIFICCSASRKVVGAEMSEDGYIQGSGDDSEGWSYGLTAKLFWDNRNELTTAMNHGGEIEELVKNLVQQSKLASPPSSAVLIRPTTNLFLSSNTSSDEFDLIIKCNDGLHSEPNAKFLGIGCKEGKLGSKMLRDKLATVKQRVQALLATDIASTILVTCLTGRDLSVGVALALLCLFYSDAGSLELNRTYNIDKQFIKQRLAWITFAKPDANPSRATLQAVNSFLMDRPA